MQMPVLTVNMSFLEMCTAAKVLRKMKLALFICIQDLMYGRTIGSQTRKNASFCYKY